MPNETIEAEYEDNVYGGDEESTALAVVDVVPQFSITLHEARQRTADLKQFCKEQLSEGEDFGIIPGCKKPSLFKPGAEKLNMIFGLAPHVETLSKVNDVRGSFYLDADGRRVEVPGYVEYEIKVTLIHKGTGRVEAEGIGSCNSMEKKYRNQPVADVANTVMKMAKKRALVDATLSATRASGIFTQDVEDMPRDSFSDRQQPRRNESRSQPQYDNRTPNYAERQPRRLPQNGNSEDVCTDAQQRAILAVAARVFGRAGRDEGIGTLTTTPLEQLTKSQASTLIEELRERLP